MKTQKLDRKRARAWRVVSTVLLVLLTAYILHNSWTVVSSSFALIRHAESGWVLLSIALMGLTFCLAAAMYGLLALHPLKYFQTLLVEVAAAFVGRLLPAGLGGLGLNGVYLFRRRHTAADATVVTSVNNVIGVGMHVLLLGLVITFNPRMIGLFTAHSRVKNMGSLMVVVIILVLLVPAIRTRLKLLVRNVLASLRKERLGRVLTAGLLSGLLTLSYTLILFCVSRSLGLSLSLLQIFIVFSIGMFVGTVTPAPGGLVGTEAGLYSALLGFGARDSSAVATVVIFRLVTYWLPLVPGVFALGVARSKDLV